MLRADQITVHAGLDLVLDHVRIAIGGRDRIGLVGPNGSGKTTLLRVLAGELHPDGGRVIHAPGVRVGWQRQSLAAGTGSVTDLLAAAAAPVTTPYAAVGATQRALAAAARGRPVGGPGIDPELRALAEAEERFAAAGGLAALARQEEVRSRLGVGSDDGIDPSRELASLSGGEQARVALACLLLADPDVLLLDEPTNHLDLDGRRWLATYLQGFRGAVLVASHDRAFLDRTVTHIVELDDLTGTLEDFPGGGWSAYREEKGRRTRRLQLDLQAQEKFRRRIAERIAASKQRAAAHEAANPRNPGARRVARMTARKALVHERRLARMMAAASWVSEPQHRDPLAFAGPVAAEPPRIVRVRGLPVAAGPRLLFHADLTLETHDRVWITGANGAGKTSLLRALVPLVDGVSMLDQRDEGSTGADTAVEVLRAAVPLFVAEAESVLAAYGFDEVSWSRPVRRLSVGERGRLRLAVALARPASMLVLDEPTDHLDADTVEHLEGVLRGFPGGLLVVTHDERFAEAIDLRTRWDVSPVGLRAGPSSGQSSPR